MTWSTIDKMSFDVVRLRTFVSLRLKSSQLQNFFHLLKHRKINRGDTDNSLKITDKPFEEHKPSYSTTRSKTKSSSKSRPAPRKLKATLSGAATKKRKKVKIETKISSAKF